MSDDLWNNLRRLWQKGHDELNYVIALAPEAIWYDYDEVIWYDNVIRNPCIHRGFETSGGEVNIRLVDGFGPLDAFLVSGKVREV